MIIFSVTYGLELHNAICFYYWWVFFHPVKVLMFYNVQTTNLTIYYTFKYIWTNRLSKNNRGCALVRTKTSNDNNKQQHNNHNFECLYSMFINHHICVILWHIVRHIDSWNCPKFMHISKNTKIYWQRMRYYYYKWL